MQFVVMHEAFSTNGENLWMGQALTSSDGVATIKSCSDFGVQPAELASTPGRRVLIATPGFAALGLVTPDYTDSQWFLPLLANGTVNYCRMSIR